MCFYKSEPHFRQIHFILFLKLLVIWYYGNSQMNILVFCTLDGQVLCLFCIKYDIYVKFVVTHTNKSQKYYLSYTLKEFQK